MTDWAYLIDVSDIWHNDEFTLIAKAHALAARVQNSLWYMDVESAGGDPDIDSTLDMLERAKSPWEFDQAWDQMYDLADKYGVWINTKEDHQNERGTTNSPGRPTTRDAQDG